MYGRTVHLWLRRSSYPLKYRYLIDLHNQGKLGLFFDEYGSSIFKGKFFWCRALRFLHWIELRIWLRINGVRKSDLILTRASKLSTSDSVYLFAFEHLQGINSQGVNPVFYSKDRKFSILCHLSHYCFRTREISDRVGEMGCVTMLSEGVLNREDSYYRKFFNRDDIHFKWIPFVVQSKFKSTAPYSSRRNVAIATGSFMSYPKEDHTKEFIEFYGTDTLQPLRKELWWRKDELQNIIDVNISSINEYWLTDRRYAKNLLELFISYLYQVNRDLTKNWIRHYSSSPYYSSDIVTTYNKYKMAVVAEEVGDLPAIGAFEAMACGCAVFLNHTLCYAEMGLSAGQHFIAYDGTLEDLKEKIKFYQNEPNLLSKIAERGEKKVREICTSNYVAGRLLS